jgi:hypothetical protein
MHGGNVEAALAKALKDNNRLAALYRENPDAFQPGGPADPSQLPPDVDEVELFQEPEASPLELPEVEIDPSAVLDAVNQRVYSDPNATGLIQAYMTNKARLDGNPQSGEQGLNRQIEELNQKVNYESMKMNDPDLASDDLQKGEIESRLMRMQTQLGLLQQERSRLQFENQNLDAQFRSYRGAIEQQVQQEFIERAEEEAYTTYEQQVEAAEERRIITEWPGAIQRVVQELKLPPEQIEDFSQDALRAYAATTADGETVVEDLNAFLRQVGEETVARLDRYHRLRAGQYAHGAATRAATPSPPTGPPGAAPPPEAQSPSPEDAMAAATHYLRQRMRG